MKQPNNTHIGDPETQFYVHHINDITWTKMAFHTQTITLRASFQQHDGEKIVWCSKWKCDWISTNASGIEYCWRFSYERNAFLVAGANNGTSMNFYIWMIILWLTFFSKSNEIYNWIVSFSVSFDEYHGWLSLSNLDTKKIEIGSYLRDQNEYQSIDINLLL